MNTKLTLKLDKQAIESAKEYAQKTNQSLSILVQNFFNVIAAKVDNQNDDISPLVQELSGIIHLENNIDLKEEYHKHINEKYS